MTKIRVLTTVLIAWSCTQLSCLGHDALDALVFRGLGRWAVSESQLIYLEVDPPKGWRLGASGDLLDHFESDFVPGGMLDRVIYTQRSSESCILVQHRPLLGRSAFGYDPERFAARYVEWQAGWYRRWKRPIVSTSTPVTRQLATRLFHVTEFVVGEQGERRRVVLYQHLSDDVRDFFLFAISSPARDDEETQAAFAQFIELIERARYGGLPAYEAALYRAEERLWMTSPRVSPEWSNALKEESAQELAQAVDERPHDWRALFRLAAVYYHTDYYILDGEPINYGGGVTGLPTRRFDAPSALTYYMRVVDAEAPPRFTTEAYFRILQILDGADRTREAEFWVRRAAADDRVQEWAESRGGRWAIEILERARATHL